MSDRHRIEETLRQIPGVLSARILGAGDQFEEVHVLADDSRHPKHVARDVETCLAVELGLDIDHRRISVAQMERPAAADARFRMEAMTLRLEEREMEVAVDLRFGDQKHTGKASGPASARQRLVLTAQATAKAIETAIGSEVRFVVEDAARFRIGDSAAVAVVLTLADFRGEEPLSGCAYVRRDELEASARATLAAVNRRLGLLLEAAV